MVHQKQVSVWMASDRWRPIDACVRILSFLRLARKTVKSINWQLKDSWCFSFENVFAHQHEMYQEKTRNFFENGRHETIESASNWATIWDHFKMIVFPVSRHTSSNIAHQIYSFFPLGLPTKILSNKEGAQAYVFWKNFFLHPPDDFIWFACVSS